MRASIALLTIVLVLDKSYCGLDVEIKKKDFFEEILNLWTNTYIPVLNHINQLNTITRELAKQETGQFDSELLKMFNTTFSRCYASYYDRLSKDIAGLLVTDSVLRECASSVQWCYEQLTDILNWINGMVKPIIDDGELCHSKERNCDSKRIYFEIKNQMILLKEISNSPEKLNITEEDINAIRLCIKYKKSMLIDRVNIFELPFQKCKDVHNYNDLLRNLRLVPLTVDSVEHYQNKKVIQLIRKIAKWKESMDTACEEYKSHKNRVRDNKNCLEFCSGMKIWVLNIKNKLIQTKTCAGSRICKDAKNFLNIYTWLQGMWLSGCCEKPRILNELLNKIFEHKEDAITSENPYFSIPNDSFE